MGQGGQRRPQTRVQGLRRGHALAPHPVRDRRARHGRALQRRLGRERDGRSPRHAVRRRSRGVPRHRADSAALLAYLHAVDVPARHRLAARRRRRGADRQGRAALARSGLRHVPAVGGPEARRADDVRVVHARAAPAADVRAGPGHGAHRLDAGAPDLRAARSRDGAARRGRGRPHDSAGRHQRPRHARVRRARARDCCPCFGCSCTTIRRRASSRS